MSRNRFAALSSMCRSLLPLAQSIDESMGWGQAGQRAELNAQRIQYTHVRTMREVAREQRERELHELKVIELQNKLAQQENLIAAQSLKIDQMRKEMGLDAAPFDPVSYDG